MGEYLKDDLYAVVNSIIDDRLRYFRSYTGVIKSIDSDGFAVVYSLDFGNDENNPSTWLQCAPGSIIYSAIPPVVNDNVTIYFPDGNAHRPRYTVNDPYTYKSTNGGLNKYVLFELDNVYIMYDKNASTLTFASNANPAQKMVLGENLQAQLTQLKTDLNNFITADYNVHTHLVPAAPGTSNVTLAIGSASTADFSANTILSPNSKNS